MAENFEVTVSPNDVAKTIKDGQAQGWELLSTESTPDGQMLLKFKPSVQFPTASPASAAPAKKKKSGIMEQLVGLLMILGICCAATYIVTGGSQEVDTIEPTATTRTLNQPQPRPTTAPTLVFDEETLFTLVRTVMLSNNLPITSLEQQNNQLTIVAPSTNDDFNSIQEYRFSIIGGVIGSLVEGYKRPETIVDPPRSLLFEFKDGSIVSVRVTITYADATAFVNGSLTESQFLSRWNIE
jgi:hypothetical protein